MLESNEENRYVIILRGVQGSGKSTYAQRFGRHAYELFDKQLDIDGVETIKIVSADYYFIRPDGTYDWSPKTLKQAHNWCHNEFRRAVIFKTKFILVDNTNTQKEQYQHYIDFAELHGYKVIEKVIGVNTEENLKLYASRNVHNVPYETVKNTWKKLQGDLLRNLTQMSEDMGGYFDK